MTTRSILAASLPTGPQDPVTAIMASRAATPTPDEAPITALIDGLAADHATVFTEPHADD